MKIYLKHSLLVLGVLLLLPLAVEAVNQNRTVEECQQAFPNNPDRIMDCAENAPDYDEFMANESSRAGRGNIGELGSAGELNIPENRSFQPSDLRGVLNTVFGILGGVAVIFVIVGGLKYITGSGKPDELQKAKNTVLYAIIGLVISIFAMTIVNFVISSL